MQLFPLQIRHAYAAFFIGLPAFLLRLAFVSRNSVTELAGGDPAAYWSFAQGVASGQGFHSAIEPWLADRPPLYSYFLVSIFLVFGQSRMAVFVVQAAVGAFGAGLFYLCMTRLLGEYRGLVGGLLFALFPHFLLFTKQILTEAVYIPLLVAMLAALLLPVPTATGRLQWIVVGVILGLLVLVRREAIAPASIVVVVVTCLRTKSDRRQLVRAATLVAIFGTLTVSPWVIRNWVVLGTPVLSSSSGVNFLVGNNPIASGAYTPPPPEWAVQFTGLGEMARDRMAWDLSVGWVRAHPGDFLQLLPRKLIALWGPANNLVLDATDLSLVPFYIVGLVRLTRRRIQWGPVAATAIPLVLCVTLTGLVFVGGWRYRLGAYPGLLLLATYGAPSLGMWWENRLQGLFSGGVGIRAS